MNREFFPDGTPIDDWFYQTETPQLSSLGKAYSFKDYGILPNAEVQTEKIQGLIDRVANEGGGVIIVPEGVYRTGALFFKQGVHLYIEKDGVLLGSDDIADYPVMPTRIEGESCLYFSALINVDNVNGFVMCGKGTIDGNGMRSWRAFWIRRQWNPNCTNKDEQRPRLVYISNSQNVFVSGLLFKNSQFWTNHIYKCRRVKYIDCEVYAQRAPVPPPSTDGLDVDVCEDVLVKNCRFELNDDGIALKGGKGPWADTLPENGGNQRVLIEDCVFGPCCSVVTCGSESVYNRNILIRRIKVDGPMNVLWLKMRPDTPQRYEYITVEEVTGKIDNFFLVRPWTQFFDLKDRKEIPLSYAENVIMRDCNCLCDMWFNVERADEQYLLSGIRMENLQIQAMVRNGLTEENRCGVAVKNVFVNGEKILND